MIELHPLNDRTEDRFRRLFTEYYDELDCGEDCAHLVDEYIIPDLKAGLLRIYLAFEGECTGFVIFQRDEIDNDWNFMEGWGDIREIYVIPSRRRMGTGRFLLYTAELMLKESGSERVYALPTPESEEFFLSCGYKKTERYCPETENYVFEKHGLDNRCHK